MSSGSLVLVDQAAQDRFSPGAPAPGVLRLVPAEHQDSQTKSPAHEQVGDLERNDQDEALPGLQLSHVATILANPDRQLTSAHIGASGLTVLVMRDARCEDGTMVATRPSSGWDRYAWVAGILFIVALAAETAVAFGVGVNQDDSAAKIATALYDHRQRLVAIACLSVVYAAMFPIYLSRLYHLLRGEPGRRPALGSLVLVGGVLFVALHAVSDVAITGLLGAKLASFGFQHDPGVSYTLYLMTYALDSVGDVFGSLFAVAVGLLVIGSGVLPRWLGWMSVLVGILFFLQGFGLGIATFGVVLDGIGFVLLLIFVLVSSVILLRRESARSPAPRVE